MTLTRNLYELDEVVAALQLCLRKGWGRALFWLWELVVSKEEQLALETMGDLWFRLGGGLFIHQIKALEMDDSKWIDCCLYTMDAIKLSAGLTAERFLALTSTMPDRRMMTPLPKNARAEARRRKRSAAFLASLDPAEEIDREEAARFWISYDSACRQGSRTDAVWLIQAAVNSAMSGDAIWLAIRIAARGPSPHTLDAILYLQETAGPDPVEQILHMVTATLLLCIPSSQRFTEQLVSRPGHYRHDWAHWNSIVGTRAARIHSIPEEAKIVRGRLPAGYSNIDELRNPITLLLEGCAFWQEVANFSRDPELDTPVFDDDEALEDFYDRYFPDDVPDEWPIADQVKSHGPGPGPGSGQTDLEMLTDGLQALLIREEPVSRKAWRIATHVRAIKS